MHKLLLAALILGLTGALARAGDWPMYRHHTARSGVTDERPGLPLAGQWVYRAPVAPTPAWPAPQINVERPKVNFDNALHAIAVGGAGGTGAGGAGPGVTWGSAPGRCPCSLRLRATP